MPTKIIKNNQPKEAFTEERCYIKENYSAPNVSIAQARVRPGVTTRLHSLKGVEEIYIVVRGKGKVEIGDLEPAEVGAGDVVLITPGTSQKITNVGKTDLLFYCVCTPRFTAECYSNLESEK